MPKVGLRPGLGMLRGRMGLATDRRPQSKTVLPFQGRRVTCPLTTRYILPAPPAWLSQAGPTGLSPSTLCPCCRPSWPGTRFPSLFFSTYSYAALCTCPGEPVAEAWDLQRAAERGPAEHPKSPVLHPFGGFGIIHCPPWASISTFAFWGR